MKISRFSQEELITIDSYSKIAKSRSETHSNRDFWLSEINKFKSLLPSGKIIDLGCGNGRDAPVLIDRGYQYVGVDISGEMLELAREFAPGALFLKGDIYDLDFPFGTFDGFWAPAVLLHMPKNKVAAALKEISRITKRGGIGFFAMKEGQGEKLIRKSEQDKRFYAFYRQGEFTDILEKSGFEVLKAYRDHKGTETVWIIAFARNAGIYFKVLTQDLMSVALLGAHSIKYKVGEWVYPGESLSGHPRKGGGLHVCKTAGEAKQIKRYVKRKHDLSCRIFSCLIGSVLYENDSRAKTDKVMLLEEI